MSNDLPARLRKALDANTDHAPALHRRLLYEAGVEIERLRAQRWSLKEAIDELVRLRELLAARIKRDDDGGAPEVILAGPPNRPRGPVPTLAASVTVDEDGR